MIQRLLQVAQGNLPFSDLKLCEMLTVVILAYICTRMLRKKTFLRSHSIFEVIVLSIIVAFILLNPFSFKILIFSYLIYHFLTKLVFFIFAVLFENRKDGNFGILTTFFRFLTVTLQVVSLMVFFLFSTVSFLFYLLLKIIQGIRLKFLRNYTQGRSFNDTRC
jgi:hypothetical protein